MYERTKPRRPIAAMHKGPGPVYALPSVLGYQNHCQTKRVLPAYTISSRHGQDTEDCSPGPKYAIEKGFTRTGPDGAAKVGISGRHADLTSFMTPSPDKYPLDAAGKWTHPCPPAYSMASRTKHSKTDNTPSPNAYSLPTTLGEKCVDKSSAPCPGIRSRPGVGGFSEDLQKTPGPGAYKVPDPNLYKGRCPAVSMTGKNVLPGDSTVKPGPGSHKPEGVTANRRQAPAFSFGIRHSEYIAPLIAEPADYCD